MYRASVNLGSVQQNISVFLVVSATTVVKIKVKVTLRLTVSQSVSLGVEPRLGS
jgi:hypothetical protein